MSVAAPRLVEPATKPRPGDTAIIQPLEVAPTVFIGDAIPAHAVETSPARARAADPVPPIAKPAPLAAKPGPPVVKPGSPVANPRPKVRPTPVPPVAPVAAPAAADVSMSVPVPTPVVPVPAAPRISLPPRSVPSQPTPPTARLSMPTSLGSDSPASDNPASNDAASDNPASEEGAAVASTPAPSFVPQPVANATPALGDQKPDLEHDLHHDLEATRIVASRRGDRFVLQFSTGENTTVYGTGLVGRNPVTQPGEYVDQIVTILDPGKSVSKTHIEFGQTAGAFWVVDRYSANGTVVRQPDAPPQRLDPGKRQPIARGSRVDMGEQFFVVS